MSDLREHLYLAALLHDIGKFYQRADDNGSKKSSFVKDYNKAESTFCPQRMGKYTHKHVLWTAQFIDDFRTQFDALERGDELLTLDARDNLQNLAASHHLSFDQLSALGKLLKEADSLSAGMDRDSDEAYKDAEDEEPMAWDSFKRKRMVSILEGVFTNEKYSYELPVSALSIHRTVFPTQELSMENSYASLWHSFTKDFACIKSTDYESFSNTLLSLLYKYTTSIPSSTIHFPDTSLYDHAKTTAAIAVCLYDVTKEAKKEESPFLLIGGDFSGIQSYIYQIISENAGKSLKGRSFYLKLLSDSIVRLLINELNLFQANVIYNSGGSFYILAPNTSTTRSKLEEVITRIEANLFKHHGTSLFVAIAAVPVSKEILLRKGNETLGSKWDELFQKRDILKKRKNATIIQQKAPSFFLPSQEQSHGLVDAITGEEFLKDEKIIQKDGLHIKPLTFQQIELGKRLRDTDIMIVSKGRVPYWASDFHMEPGDFGFCYYFKSKEALRKDAHQLKQSVDHVSIVTFNELESDESFLNIILGTDNSYSVEFYGGNKGPNKRDHTPLTYEEMTKDESFVRMGVLRMDVDNLGRNFRMGISPSKATLSRYSALSRSMDFFFSGYLNSIWKEVAPTTSLIVYSGGDDLFVIGKWSDTIKLAERIQLDFKAYTCQNKAFSLSGGLVLFPPKFPVMKSAHAAADEESRAKNHMTGGHEKNAISFFEMPMNWDLEYPVVKEAAVKLATLIDGNLLPKSFISKLLSHYESANFHDHTIENVKTFWMISYDLGRLVERGEKKQEARSLIENCIKDVCTASLQKKLNGRPVITNYHPLELWAFVCRWAELMTRDN
jgi:CRISPR-associated protein Csm1